MTYDHIDAITEAPAESPVLDDFGTHSTNDLMDGIEANLDELLGQTEGTAMGIVYVVRDEFTELRRRVVEAEQASTVTGYCTACREAQTTCDEDMCCLSCGRDLAPVADHGAEVLTEALGALDQRIAALEAEASRLRIRAEAREAQLAHAQDRLRRLGQADADVQGTLDRLQASGAAIEARWWDGFGDAEARVTVAEGRSAEVDAAMLAVGFYPVGVPVPTPGGMARGYSTDGTRPWEAELDDPTADTAEEPPEAPAPTPAAASPWRPPGWYRDVDGQVGELYPVDRFRGTQTFRWCEPPAVLGPGLEGVRYLGPASVQRLEPVPTPGEEPAGGAR
jgi:hypothetical protein